MKQLLVLSAALYALPLVIHAQIAARGTLGFYIVELIKFFDRYVIPLILALAFLFFIWNAAKYFIFSGANDEDLKKAKSLMLWGFLGFVLILSTWGIVGIFIDGLKLEGFSPSCPDYNPNCRN
jgi:Type IV secretion system pilin